MSMQLTAYSIADLWKEGMTDFYLYELTKTNKVVKHKIRALSEFDECVIIAIGDDKNFPKHRLVFSPGSGTKRLLGDSMYYTDFSAIKSKFNAKNGIRELRDEVQQLQKDIKALQDVHESKCKKLNRLEEGMEAEYLQELDEDDKERKDFVTSHLKKSIYHYAARYGTDLSFTFLIDRIWLHSNQEMSKEEFIKMNEEVSNEDLMTKLNEVTKK